MALRDAVLHLANKHPYARRLVNSGRLSTPTPYLASNLNTADQSNFEGTMHPGTNCADAPVVRNGKPSCLVNELGDGFTVLVFGARPTQDQVRDGNVTASILSIGSDLIDADGLLGERYDGQPGTTYLIRPDRHVAARWRKFSSVQARTQPRRSRRLL